MKYWPRRKAMYWWSQFDAGEVDDDFTLIQSLGLNVARIFLLWDDFQPDPANVDKNALANLVKVADLAEANHLGLDVTFFTGHMSGPNWSPRWLIEQGDSYPSHYFGWVRHVVSQGKIVPNGNYRNLINDPQALEAERLLLRTVVSALKGHPGVGLWNLGNEPDLFAWPENAVQGRLWVREMTELIKEIDPETPVTVGLHSAEIEDDMGTLHVGEEVAVDIWLNDVPEKLLHAGFWIDFDSEALSLMSVEIYDGFNGPWDPGFTHIVKEITGPGTLFILLGQYSCPSPDPEGDIILAKVRFRCLSPGNTAMTIRPTRDPGFATVVGCSAFVYDSAINPNLIAFSQISCAVVLDCDDYNLCTTNSCETSTGTCFFNQVIDCDDDNLCTSDSCIQSPGSVSLIL